MICPSCAEDMEPVGTDIAPPLAICPKCEHSLVVTDTGVRIAQATDADTLTADQKTALVQLRVNTRTARRAYYTAHHG